ncbi:Retrovirus-related Pol polyprotein from transposon RE1 [Cardamine amara subsp. amara]|uniref:Retrovirus-related Pol polyprotein from transposon RE1 n=1 Tax=Cardamine amara subsp. amara TaxID=228776 RepID=A0ABD1BQZ1_CARAN
MAATNTTVVTDAADATANSVFIFSMTNATKLTPTNYLKWSLQVHALLDGYGLAGYFDGSVTTPAATLTTGDVVTVNPAFIVWKSQDKLIYSGLIGAINITIQSLVSCATTSYETWQNLASTYAKPSRGHIKKLKTQLKQWTKGNKTVDEYVQGLTTRMDQLAILGKAMDHEDHIEMILKGLPNEYKPVIDQMEGRDVPPSIIELHQRLLNQEAKLLAAGFAPSSPATANMAQHRPTPNSNRSNDRNQNRNNNNNHIVPTGSSPHNSNNWQVQRAGPPQRYACPYLVRCQLCGVHGHSAKWCPQLSSLSHAMPPHPSTLFTPWQPCANIAVGPQYTANNWLLDSGAIHHITSDLNNLALHQPYNGGDDLLIGDGSGLAISHTGEGSQLGGTSTSEQNQ